MNGKIRCDKNEEKARAAIVWAKDHGATWFDSEHAPNPKDVAGLFINGGELTYTPSINGFQNAPEQDITAQVFGNSQDAKQDADIEYFWSPVKDYEGMYEVSKDGEIRAVRRQGTDGRILRQTTSKKGYKMVNLCKNGSYKNCLVHRLVAEAFLPNPDELPCVNHKDENKQNNHVENLEWCSIKYNNNYGTARSRASVARYKRCIGKWPDGSELEFHSCTIASKETGISQGNIWGACNGLWKTAGGIEWRYV